MTLYPPTKRQHELLDYLTRYAAEHKGRSPTFAEMAEGIGLASKSAVARLLDGLEERGLVRRLPARARSVVLTFPSGVGKPNTESPWAHTVAMPTPSRAVSPWFRA